MKICIVGMGEIGSAVMKAIKAKGLKDDTLYGIDVNDEIISKRRAEGFNVGKEYKGYYDVYILSVWTTDQVMKVLDCIDFENNPLIIIESTIIPGTVEKVKAKIPHINLVVCPHRYFADDPSKNVFNLKRVIGAVDDKTLDKGIKFYTRYMSKDLLHKTDIKTAELCKPLENSIRYVEIALSEEIRMLCMENGYDYKRVRDAVNTKWNINLLEAREGIGRHCLPKDIVIINDLFEFNNMFSTAKKVDEIYRGMFREWNRKK